MGHALCSMMMTVLLVVLLSPCAFAAGPEEPFMEMTPEEVRAYEVSVMRQVAER